MYLTFYQQILIISHTSVNLSPIMFYLLYNRVEDACVPSNFMETLHHTKYNFRLIFNFETTRSINLKFNVRVNYSNRHHQIDKNL